MRDERTGEESGVRKTQERREHQEAGVRVQKLINSPASHADQPTQSTHARDIY